jgi:hypothetical protein
MTNPFYPLENSEEPARSSLQTGTSTRSRKIPAQGKTLRGDWTARHALRLLLFSATPHRAPVGKQPIPTLGISGYRAFRLNERIANRSSPVTSL